MKRFFKRLKYWFTHPHKAYCPHCCLFCTVYDACKRDTDKFIDKGKGGE